MSLIRARLKGGQPVKDVEMDTAPSHARTRRLVRKTALRRRLDHVNASLDPTVIGRFILGAQDKRESAFAYRNSCFRP
jgi:hypothetical protein